MESTRRWSTEWARAIRSVIYRCCFRGSPD